MKILDWYIIRKFIGTYIYAIILIVGIAVIFDFSEKIDDFMEKGAPFNEIIFRYYLNFIPYFANLFSSLFVFIAVIFFTSNMAYNTEII
ncbi:MAG TPA: LptF/LptG family permease, partial [Tenuifilaceae bacterium]|nr:LptF/LptG family permease [Tenuifilaceae bacterium]